MSSCRFTVVLACVLGLVALPLSAQTPPDSEGPILVIMFFDPGSGGGSIRELDPVPYVAPAPPRFQELDPVPYVAPAPPRFQEPAPLQFQELDRPPIVEPAPLQFQVFDRPPLVEPAPLQFQELDRPPIITYGPTGQGNLDLLVVPEPGSVALLVAGGLWLLGWRWRRRRRR